jgi:hypothetical protein
MNGFQPDRRPQQMARMLAMQERNSSLNAPPGQRDMAYRQTAGLGYAQPTPNVAPGVPPQAMNFNGPPQAMQGGRPFGYGQSMGGTGMMGMGAPRNAPMRSPQVGMGVRPRVSSPGMTTPQGGRYRGDFDDGAE